MPNTRSDIDQDLVKALSHPLRQRAFGILSQREASPSELAAELGEPLGNVAYHVQVLKKLGCLELVRTTPVRGAVEHHYRAVKLPFFSDEDWAQLPASLRSSVSAGLLAEIWKDARAALEQGSFDARDDRHLSWTDLVLDDEGFGELAALLSDVLERVQRIQAESMRRIERSGAEAPPTSKLVVFHYEAGPKAA